MARWSLQTIKQKLNDKEEIMDTIKSLKEKLDKLQLEKVALTGCMRALDEYMKDINEVINQIEKKEV